MNDRTRGRVVKDILKGGYCLTWGFICYGWPCWDKVSLWKPQIKNIYQLVYM